MSNVIPFTNRPRLARREVVDDTAVYTVKEAAAVLRIGLSSAYALVREGTIPARRAGGRWLIPKARLHAWLNGDTDQPEVLATRPSGGR